MEYAEDLKKIGIDIVKTTVVDFVLYWGGCFVTYITLANLVNLGFKILRITPEGKVVAVVGKVVMILTLVGGGVAEIAIDNEYGIGQKLDNEVLDFIKKVNADKKAKLNAQTVQ